MILRPARVLLGVGLLATSCVPHGLAFVQDKHVALRRAFLGTSGGIRASENDELASLVAALGGAEERLFLREHGRHQDHVRPIQIFLR